MEDRPDRGFLVGNLLVVPRKGAIRSSQGTRTLAPDCMDVLLALAQRGGDTLALSDLARAAGLDRDTDRAVLEGHILTIRDALGDVGPNPRFIVQEDDTVTLIAPVRAMPDEPLRPEGDSPREEMSLFKHLQRRKVTRVAAAYVVLAWLAIQVADTILPALGLPGWAVTLTVGLALLGFPVAIAVAWLFEVTPIGTLRDRRSKPAALSRKQKIIDVAVLSCLAILVGYIALNVLLDVDRARDEGSVAMQSRMITAPSNTVAVLPFTQPNASGDNSYIGDGIAEEVLRIMSRIQELRVTARTASFYFKGKDVDPQTIARKLQVRHLLTGSVQIVGDTVRVSAELVDASSGVLLWSEVFDREMVDVFEIQSEIARAVAKSSRVMLSADSTERLEYRPTSNLQAYDFYLRGRDYLRQPRTIDVLENAQRLFHRALALDPSYALALAGLCETYLAIYIRTRSTATVDDAQSACRAALEIDESLPEVHTALGYLHWHTGEFDSAERDFRDAITIDANFYEAYAGLSDNLFSQNRIDEAGLMLQRLIDLQPAYWRGHRKMGYYYYRQGLEARALPYLQRVVELTPDNAPGWNNLGAVNYMLGNLADAADAWQRAIDIAPTQAMYANLGTMYYYLGRFEDSIDMQRKAIELAPDDYRIWGRMAAAYGRLGGRDAEAKAAYGKGISLARSILAVNPNEPDANKNVALFYAHGGQPGQAVESIEKALELTPNDPDAHFFAALTYLQLGDEERSLTELEQAVKYGYSKNLIESEWALEPLRQNVRFEVLLADHDPTVH